MTILETRESGSGGAVSASLLPSPAPLPSLSSAFSRRAALFGAVASTGFLGAAAPRLVAGVAGNEVGSADARLAAIADELQAIETACNAHAAAHRGRETKASEADFEALVNQYDPLEEEMAELAADTLSGVLAKVRVLDIPTCRDAESGIADSVCDDIRRLHAAGGGSRERAIPAAAHCRQKR